MNTEKFGVVRMGKDDILVNTDLDTIKIGGTYIYDAIAQKNVIINCKKKQVSRDKRRVSKANKSIANVFCTIKKLENSDCDDFLFKKEEVESCY